MKFKKTSAALLIAGLTVAGSSYAFANEAIFPPSDDQNEENSSEQTVTNATVETNSSVETTSDTASIDQTEEDPTNKEAEPSSEAKEETNNDELTEKTEFPEIPEGYTAGNLIALKQAYENAGNENAKAAILRNAQRAIEKFEEKHGTTKDDTTKEVQVELELVGTIEPGETAIQFEEEASTTTVKQETNETNVNSDVNKKSLKEQQKLEKKALKEEHKTEKQALKAEHKAEKQAAKNNKE
nr:hypothetical protein [Lysinibacillus timonensis]